MADLSKATPRPWAVGEALFGYRWIRQDPKDWNGMGYQLICNLPAEGKKGQPYREMFDANAALIVKAVNHHEALVSSLTRVRAKLRDFIRDHPDPGADALAAEWEAGDLLSKVT